MKTFFLALLMSLLAFSTAIAAGDEEAIQTRLDEFVAAWNHHDAKAMAAIWAPDGDLINPFGRVAKGRPEVEKLFIDEHASFMKGTTYKVTSSSVRVLGSEAAVLDFDAEITGMKAPDGSDRPAFEHHVTIVMVKKDGAWWFVAARPVGYLPTPGESES
ncbi:MAG: SgcJ/EcaC family oxidoreductase [Vicinamibacteria bacterium]